MKRGALAVAARKRGDHQPGVHQERARIDLAGSLFPIIFRGVETAQLQHAVGVNLLAHGDEGEKRFGFVRRNDHPGGAVGVFKRGDQAVKIAFPDEPIIFVVGLHLRAGNFPLLVGEFSGVKLVAEGAPHGHVAFGLVAGARGSRDVRPHGGGRIAKRGAELNGQALDGIGVVAGPDLRGVGEHGGVKASAAARAVFKQDVGEGGDQPVHQVVGAEDEAVEKLALLFIRQKRRAGVGDVAVEVPFQIVDLVGAEHLDHFAPDVIAHILARNVQHILMTAEHGNAALHMDVPVRVRAEQVGIGRNHFRLVPDAEFQPSGVDALDQRLEATGELLFVDLPVAQRRVVVVAAAEPAVVHHQHFKAHLGGRLGEGHQLFGVEIKERAFPAVDEERALFGFPAAANEATVVKAVENAAHFTDAAVGIDHHRLRRFKALAGEEIPDEIGGIDAHDQAGGAVEIAFGEGGEVARIDQIEAVNAAVLLIRTGCGERHEGVLAVAGNAALAFHALHTVGEGTALHIALAGVAAVKRDEVVIHGWQVEREGEGALQLHGLFGGIAYHHAAGQHVLVRKNGVIERGVQAGHGIFRVDDQGFAVIFIVCVGGGLAGDGRLAPENFVADIAQIGHAVARAVADRERRDAEIARAVDTVFHRSGVGRKAVFGDNGVGQAEGGADGALFKGRKVGIRNKCAVIKVQKVVFVVNFDDVAGKVGVQLEGARRGVKADRHNCVLFLLI